MELRTFTIGARPPEPATAGVESSPTAFRSTARHVGASLARARHVVLACSPYDGSADVEVLAGFAGALPDGADQRSVELHYPEEEGVMRSIDEKVEQLGLGAVVERFGHPALFVREQELDRTYSWMLSQLAALDGCTGVIALGGRSDGSANLLLHLAEARRVPVLPVPYLGGAAQLSYSRLRYQLEDRLGERGHALRDPAQAHQLPMLLEMLAAGSSGRRRRDRSRRFFISYARARPGEADFVETTLRRRNQDVFRDDHGLEKDAHLPSVIRDQVYAADVFIVLWTREYACSPWCHDEFEMALERRERQQTELLILVLDDTRIVPKAARSLLHHRCGTRAEIEARILAVLGED